MIVSGLSGGGKTAAAKLFEDLGYTVVDNLPGRAAARPRRARLCGSRAVRAGRDRARRAGRRRDAGAGGDARRARGPRDPAAGLLPRGERRRPHPAVQRDAPSPPARRRARDRQLDRRGAPPPRRRAQPTRTSSSTPPTCRCASCASGSSPRWPPTSGPTSSRSSSSASASSTACRSRPTSSSTSGSCRTRTTSPELRPLSGLTERGPRVRPRPAGRRAIPRLPRSEFLDFAIPAYIAEGKTRLTIAIGCTGGYHRSIVITEELASWLREQDFGPVAVFHRELERA